MVIVCCLMLYFSIVDYVLWFVVYLLLSVTESIVLLSFSWYALLTLSLSTKSTVKVLMIHSQQLRC